MEMTLNKGLRTTQRSRLQHGFKSLIAGFIAQAIFLVKSERLVPPALGRKQSKCADDLRWRGRTRLHMEALQSWQATRVCIVDKKF